MASNQNVYSQVLERELSKGVGMEKAHNAAVSASESANRVINSSAPIKKTAKKSSVAKATPDEQKVINKRLAKQYPSQYSEDWVPGMKKKIKKEFESQRTKKVSGQLKKSGLTDEEIAKLRG